MSEQTPAPASQVDATTPTAPVTPEPTKQEPQFLTREEAEAWKSDILNQAKSYSDKGRINLQKQMAAVNETIANAAKFGKPISAEDQAAMRKQAEVVAATVPLDDEPGQIPEQTPEQAQAIAQELYAHDLKMQGKHDVAEFTEADPEIKMIKVTGNVAADKPTIEAAYLAKKNRLSSTPQTPIAEVATPAGVRVGGTIGTKPNVPKSARGYLEEAFK